MTNAEVRWTVEFAQSVHNGWMWDFTSDALREMIGSKRLEEFKQRAQLANVKQGK